MLGGVRGGGKEYWERRLKLGWVFQGEGRNLMQWKLLGFYQDDPSEVLVMGHMEFESADF